MARILHLITSSGIGGTELSLLQLLSRLERSRFESVVVSLKEPGEVAARIRSLGIEVLSLHVSDETGPWGAFELLLASLRLPRLLGRRQIDLVHSFLFRAHLVGRLAAPRLGARAIVNSYRSGVEGKGRWLERADRWTLRRVTRFHLQSEGLAKELRRRLGLEGTCCAVVPNGIDLTEAETRLAGARPEARARLGLRGADLCIVSIGRLHAEKGVGVLLAAFRALLQAVPTARLILAGDGPERGALERSVDTLGLRPFVRLLGNVPSPWPLLAAADIFALPSLWEGMPNALLEAMAAGLPVVATAVGAVPEMIIDGGEGRLVPPDDPGELAAALIDLGDSSTRRAQMGGMGRERVERGYRIEDTTAGIERLYAEVLAETAGSRR